jgi:5-methylcytosine-specific restriction endonuclease McrA
MTKKVTIPKAVREQCWLQVFGKTFEHSCYIPWCKNIINVWDFHVGHDIPESKGGSLDINNIKPLCARCNQSMSDNYTIQEWMKLTKPNKCIDTSCFWKRH